MSIVLNRNVKVALIQQIVIPMVLNLRPWSIKSRINFKERAVQLMFLNKENHRSHMSKYGRPHLSERVGDENDKQYKIKLLLVVDAACFFVLTTSTTFLA